MFFRQVFSYLSFLQMKGESKAIPTHAWIDSRDFRRSRLTEFMDNRRMKVVSLSALNTDRLCHPGDTAGTHFCTAFCVPVMNLTTTTVISSNM